MCVDSVESNREGGAMYIETSPSNPDGYVPNNNLFGPWIDSPTQECSASSPVCGNNCALPLSSLHGSDFVDCGNCLNFDHSLSLTQPIGTHTSYWNDEMSSFASLPPLEMEPLPSLFPFSPCGSASYNRPERPTHDVADVLLSLKNAVLKPGVDSHSCHQSQSLQSSGNYGTSPNGLSYTVHHPQILLSPSPHHHYYQCHQNQAQNGYTSNGYYDSGNSCNGHQHYPGLRPMSVNVSMNMTMHGYSDGPCSQMQWNPPPNPTPSSSSSLNVLCPPPFSPAQPYPGATYSFTADFRPTANGGHSNNNEISAQENIEEPLLEPVKSSNSPLPVIEQKPFFQNSTCYGTPKTSPTSYEVKPNISSPLKNQQTMGYEAAEDDSNSNDDGSLGKPNLCRLCGKTYARPSTLKTHLRTHSGERPYRCPDCKKSFSQAANLTAHVRTHTGQKPFRCPICDRRFSQSSSVTTHMRTHSGERPYRCRACKKAFSDSSTLTKHLRIHSGEKPYQCKLCLLRFSQSGNLNRHMRVHAGTGNLVP
ncbi:CLUMA_CG018999, isoform A [Clunio marinus]|uniref:Protein glass n=1 Tax=Clunio marinus TaxID=568069 RepID=A0A1J1J1G1_9DIPT|nr:CLUMA_CG018999, isoform A [Clunio marinus]